MIGVVIECLKQMSNELKNTECCDHPTCSVSLTPPFLERAKCGKCGKFCDECWKPDGE
jgi:hypothetical protein